MARHLRMIRAFVCYHLFMLLPLRWTGLRVTLPILPYVGDWAYQNDAREMGRDPWGPPVSAEEHERNAGVAFREMQAALDKAERQP